MTCLCLSCHFRTLLPFTCVDDSCLSVMHAGGHSHDLEYCGTVFLWVRLALSAFTPAAASLFFHLALCLVISGHASTQTCAQGSSGLHVSCFPHVWHRYIGCRPRLPIVSTGDELMSISLCDCRARVGDVDIHTRDALTETTTTTTTIIQSGEAPF